MNRPLRRRCIDRRSGTIRAFVRTAIALTVALLTAACSGTVAPGGTLTATVDLHDETLIAELGAPPVENVQWRRNLDGITVEGTTQRPDPAELDLLEAAIDDLPDRLLSVGEPRAILRVPQAPDVEQVGSQAVAFAAGPDVYLVDRTFTDNAGRLDLARALAHELTHVAQFRTLDPTYVTAVLEGRIRRVDPADGSTLVREFAAATGWNDSSADPLQPDWSLPASVTAATAYGRTSPAEDMADTVALLVAGWTPPTDRARWVLTWLDTTADVLAAGKPYIPAGSSEIRSTQPIYDPEAVADAAPGVRHVEPHYYELPASVDRHDLLAPAIEQRLLARRLSGVLTRSSDDRLPRYQGMFTRPDGVRYWVELWDFREATGFSSAPDVPVLTYVVLW